MCVVSNPGFMERLCVRVRAVSPSHRLSQSPSPGVGSVDLQMISAPGVSLPAETSVVGAEISQPCCALSKFLTDQSVNLVNGDWAPLHFDKVSWLLDQVSPIVSIWQSLSHFPGASQVALVVKNPPANAGDMRGGFAPWVGKVPWSRKWKPTPVFLPGKSHGQRSLVNYNPWDHKESYIT